MIREFIPGTHENRLANRLAQARREVTAAHETLLNVQSRLEEARKRFGDTDNALANSGVSAGDRHGDLASAVNRGMVEQAETAEREAFMKHQEAVEKYKRLS